MNPQRKPYLSKVVLRGLQTIARRVTAREIDESTALVWINRMNLWHSLPSAVSEPHDAEVCLPDEVAGTAKVRLAVPAAGKTATKPLRASETSAASKPSLHPPQAIEALQPRRRPQRNERRPE